MLLGTFPTTLFQIFCEIIFNYKVVIKIIKDPDYKFTNNWVKLCYPMHNPKGMNHSWPISISPNTHENILKKIAKFYEIFESVLDLSRIYHLSFYFMKFIFFLKIMPKLPDHLVNFYIIELTFSCLKLVCICET